jgi:acyl-CoA thioester hydrolase
MTIEFEAAAHIDDRLTVLTTPLGATGARLNLAQEVFRGAERLVEAKLVVVAITAAGRPARLPASIRNLI